MSPAVVFVKSSCARERDRLVGAESTGKGGRKVGVFFLVMLPEVDSPTKAIRAVFALEIVVREK